MNERCVYFIRPVGMSGPIKIGCTDNVEQRLKPLANWSPVPLEIVATAPGGYKDEFYIHRCFANSHSHHEWFDATPRLLKFVETVKATGSLDAMKDLQPEGIAPSMLGRPAWPDSRRQYMSYTLRVGNLARRRRRETPPEVRTILKAWQDRLGVGLPSGEELAVLDDFIAGPKGAAA